jgi:MYXO-CTERM domain-containing protein
VVVIGTNFVSGLSLKIGTIPATDVRVPGSTTILATVPASIAAGTYDVIAQNPDGQVAILQRGYTVIDTKDQAPPGSHCGCTTARSERQSGAALWLALFFGLALLARRRAALCRPDGDGRGPDPSDIQGQGMQATE